jgi:hypothetical protein
VEEHEERAKRLQRESDKMEQEAERVGGKIEETRSDWQSKEADQTVPGAQPDLEQLLEEGAEEQGEDPETDTEEEEEE